MINPLIPRVKPWVIQSVLTFDFVDRTLKCDHSLESCCAVLNCSGVCFYFTQFLILEGLSILDVPLSGVKGLRVNS